MALLWNKRAHTIMESAMVTGNFVGVIKMCQSRFSLIFVRHIFVWDNRQKSEFWNNRSIFFFEMAQVVQCGVAT